MPSSGPGASAPSSPDAELLPAPVVPAPDCWLALASALASGFLFPQPVRAMDAANTINSTSVLRITFDSQNPHTFSHTAKRRRLSITHGTCVHELASRQCATLRCPFDQDRKPSIAGRLRERLAVETGTQSALTAKTGPRPVHAPGRRRT